RPRRGEQAMSATAATKIHPQHQRRQALVYVRQSTTKQLAVNQESTRRQYQLAERAQALGWPPPRVVVIDDDLGLSGSSSEARAGFQRLVSAVGLGEVGAIFVTEISRLSRRNSDWHRVIELCAVFDTLIADEDGIYDPADPNDRLVLGLKGTLFAAELHILRARMRGGLLNKARRGALALRLPVGYRRLPDGTVVLEPDEAVRGVLATVFSQFPQLGSARAVQRYLQAHGLQMPRYHQTGPDAGRIVWVAPTYQMVQMVLHSPVYAGLFVYGRRREVITPGDPPQVTTHRVPVDEWAIVVPGVYPAYVTEDQYRANRRRLCDNQYNFVKRRRGAVREGPGLLVGLLVCGRCGGRLTPTYSAAHHAYVCRRAKATYGTPTCQSFPQRELDQTVAAAFLAAVQPAALETLLTALAAHEAERQAVARHWAQRLERARYEAARAQRQYDACEPENRLVARTLEARWEEALAAMAQVEQEYAAAERSALAPLTAAEQAAARALASDLPAVWQAATTTAADRKRLLRLVIQDVTVTVAPGGRDAAVTILWSGGATTAHTIIRPPRGWHCTTDAAVVARLRALAQHRPDHQIADLLNAEGLTTQTGKPWTHQRVASIRKQHAILTACPVGTAIHAVRGDGFMPVALAAERLGVSRSLVHVWVGLGALVGEQRVAASKRWVRLTAADAARLDGKHDWGHLPTLRQVMRERGWDRTETWARVRAGEYVAHRHPTRQRWEWRLQQARPSRPPGPSDVR
ncbi:MAG TPA: recombinase family protein, partial [Nitrolancea sp.]|nr:recombinase family protein [Nitrolancea sp.]